MGERAKTLGAIVITGGLVMGVGATVHYGRTLADGGVPPAQAEDVSRHTFEQQLEAICDGFLIRGRSSNPHLFRTKVVTRTALGQDWFKNGLTSTIQTMKKLDRPEDMADPLKQARREALAACATLAGIGFEAGFHPDTLIDREEVMKAWLLANKLATTEPRKAATYFEFVRNSSLDGLDMADAKGFVIVAPIENNDK